MILGPNENSILNDSIKDNLYNGYRYFIFTTKISQWSVTWSNIS